MIKEGFSKFYWGFFFILISFRIQGLDIIPDIVGFIFIADGVGKLLSESDYFQTAQNYTLPMILLSIFSIYEPPVEQAGINFGFLGPMGVLISIASLVLTLLLAYNIFMGIKEMAEQRNKTAIAAEAEQRWNQFLWLNLAYILLFLLIFVPPLAILMIIGLLIASIALTIAIMRLMKQCEEELLPSDTQFRDA
ncbi:hypothetical protein [Dethiobacter alkaliphilus]|uniref:hypothetical protein n=1 Tax=Dethiobacter alkaliphilus TaxID=427926 RepID=UPI002225F7DF|nr:hypothetical protein [Dethiobacter alkaliphilus]MCW3490033.1 hypothetical protein [Dethiobacter alkaliphilus]